MCGQPVPKMNTSFDLLYQVMQQYRNNTDTSVLHFMTVWIVKEIGKHPIFVNSDQDTFGRPEVVRIEDADSCKKFFPADLSPEGMKVRCQTNEWVQKNCLKTCNDILGIWGGILGRH